MPIETGKLIKASDWFNFNHVDDCTFNLPTQTLAAHQTYTSNRLSLFSPKNEKYNTYMVTVGGKFGMQGGGTLSVYMKSKNTTYNSITLASYAVTGSGFTGGGSITNYPIESNGNIVFKVFFDGVTRKFKLVEMQVNTAVSFTPPVGEFDNLFECWFTFTNTNSVPIQFNTAFYTIVYGMMT